jgi:hypothetical protein
MRLLFIVALIAAFVMAATAIGIAQPEKPGDEFKDELKPSEIGDAMVVPGERIGPLRLGMTIAQMIRVMPSGYKRDVFEKEHVILYEWRKEGVWVSIDEQSRAVRLISVFGAGAYKTDKGVALLNTESKMESVYGREYKRYEYPEDRITLVRYVPLGLHFGIANYPSQRAIHGRIFTIGIFAPDKEPPLTKAPSK